MTKEQKGIMVKFLIYISVGILIIIVGISNVLALENNNSIIFLDNNGTSLNDVSTSYTQQIDESTAIFTTTANSYGGAVLIQLPTPLISQHIYSLYVNVGAYSNGGRTSLSSKNCIGIGSTHAQAKTSYINCNISPSYSQRSGITTDKGRGLYFTFIASSNASFLVVPYTTEYTCYNCQQYSFGFEINDGGDTSGLSQSQVTNIINSQTSIIQNEISNMQTDFTNALEDSTQAQIDSQKVCDTIDKNDVIQSGKFLRSNGTIGDSSYYGVTDYINIHDAEVTVTTVFDDADSSTHLCYYTKNESLISCQNIYNLSTLTIPSNAYYLRTTIFDYRTNNKPILNVCKNGNTAINDKAEEQNKTSKGILGKIKEIFNILNPFSEDFFAYKLIELVGNLLKSLFVPSSTFIKNWYDDFKEWFELKLGFISTPFTLFVEFVETFLNLEDTNLIINIPEITVPNFENYVIIQATTFNWGELLNSKQEFRTLWTLYLDFIDVFLILNFLGLCETKYNRIFGGDTTPYEYYTTEETYNINDETGEATNHMLRQRRTRREKVK